MGESYARSDCTSIQRVACKAKRVFTHASARLARGTALSRGGGDVAVAGTCAFSRVSISRDPFPGFLTLITNSNRMRKCPKSWKTKLATTTSTTTTNKKTKPLLSKQDRRNFALLSLQPIILLATCTPFHCSKGLNLNTVFKNSLVGYIKRALKFRSCTAEDKAGPQSAGAAWRAADIGISQNDSWHLSAHSKLLQLLSAHIQHSRGPRQTQSANLLRIPFTRKHICWATWATALGCSYMPPPKTMCDASEFQVDG